MAIPTDSGLQWAAAGLAGVSLGTLAYGVTRWLLHRDDDPSESFRDAVRRQRDLLFQGDPGAGRWAFLAPLSVRLGRRFPIPDVRESIVERYRQAGWPGRLSDDHVVGLSVLAGVPVAVVAILLLLLIKPVAAPLGVLGLLFGIGGASAYLGDLAKKRTRAIAKAFPFVMDMMTMSLQAGASMQMTMERIGDDYAGHPIGEEFAAVLADIRSGASFIDAVLNLRARASMPEIDNFADDVVQSERMGRPIAETLAHSSERFKTLRIQTAREAAGKAKVLVLVPAILLLLAGLLILFAPFAIKFLKGDVQY